MSRRLTFLPLFLLAACVIDPGTTRETHSTPDQRGFVQSYLYLLSTGEVEGAISLVAPEVQSDTTRRALQGAAAVLKRARLASSHVVNEYVSRGADSGTHVVAFDMEMTAVDTTRWVVASIVARYGPDHKYVTSFSISSSTQPLEIKNRFTFAGKSPLQFVWLVLASGIPLVTIAMAVTVGFARGMPRRWLWVVGSLISSPVFIMNWTSGDVGVQESAFIFFGGHLARAGPAAPWFVSFAVPIGAAVAYLKLRRWRQSLEAGAAMLETAASPPAPARWVPTSLHRPRKPWAALLLGLMVPGLGHLYAGRRRAARVLAVVTVPLAYLLLAPVVLFSNSRMLFAMVGPFVVLTQLAGPAHAAVAAYRARRGYVLQSFNRWPVYLATAVATLAWSAVLIATAHLMIQAYRIPSASMVPTLLVGDRVWVALAPASERVPKRDSLIVFTALDNRRLMIVKRVMGYPGDTISMRDGVLTRNGRWVVETYTLPSAADAFTDSRQRETMRAWQVLHLVGRDTAGYAPDARNWGPFVVPPDSFFALGDNRDESFDSRYYGFVPFVNAHGRPRFVYFSYDSLLGFRWNRVGRAVQ